MAANGRHSFQHSKTQVLVLELIFVNEKEAGHLILEDIYLIIFQ